jgi:signal transduction histidine kinase
VLVETSKATWLTSAVQRTLTDQLQACGGVPAYVGILDQEGHPAFGSGFFTMPGVGEHSGGVSVSGGVRSQTLNRRVPVPSSGDEVARLAETMNGMLARLEASSARQQEFVSDASHELRSPVSSIRFELEVALAHPAAKDWRDVATTALRETGRIEHLIDDLLLLARLDEGAAPAATAVDITGLAHDVTAHVRDVTVDVDVADGLLVTGRDSELASVLRNLVDNAARHASSTLAVTAAADNGTVVIAVDDDGPGIPLTDRERIFQRFTRLEQSRSRTSGGVGLGLAVVDRVVRHHNGSVAVSDSPLGGARFEVTLPTAPSNPV